jgi:hypothetical protein
MKTLINWRRMLERKNGKVHLVRDGVTQLSFDDCMRGGEIVAYRVEGPGSRMAGRAEHALAIAWPFQLQVVGYACDLAILQGSSAREVCGRGPSRKARGQRGSITAAPPAD